MKYKLQTTARLRLLIDMRFALCFVSFGRSRSCTAWQTIAHDPYMNSSFSTDCQPCLGAVQFNVFHVHALVDVRIRKPKRNPPPR